ncbi:hypothetical protein MMC26_006082, partial [Xylographa opegraphella]|nr:hypothetical protein [Xylographa opegraphella]
MSKGVVGMDMKDFGLSSGKSAKHVENIFFAKMSEGRNSLVLKWKREMLDRPVFTQPMKAKGSSTLSQPLCASTWIGYLKRLGLKAGLEHSFRQYGLRRGLLNVINSAHEPIRYT